MNPLFQQMRGQMPQSNNVMQRFMQFRQQFQGDPKEQVQQLLNSGRVTQQQYDAAVQMANQLKNMLGM